MGWKRKTAFVDKIIHDIEKGGRKFLCCKNSEWKEADQHAKRVLIKGLLRVTPEEIHAASIIQRSIRKKIAMKREQGPQKVEPLLVSATRSTGGDVAENKSIMLDSNDDKSSIKDTAKHSKLINPVILTKKEIIVLGSEEDMSSVEDTSKPAHQIQPLLLTARCVTRSQSKMGGNTAETAISLDVDDESSIENFGFDSAQLFEEEDEEDEGNERDISGSLRVESKEPYQE